MKTHLIFFIVRNVLLYNKSGYKVFISFDADYTAEKTHTIETITEVLMVSTKIVMGHVPLRVSGFNMATKYPWRSTGTIAFPLKPIQYH